MSLLRDAERRSESCVIPAGRIWKKASHIMKVVCSWCRYEGKNDVVGEKPPFDDARETHGICLIHRDEVQARWRASRAYGGRDTVNDGPLSPGPFRFKRW
jgi:hypothetical protein